MDGQIFLRAPEGFRSVSWAEVEAMDGFVAGFTGRITSDFEVIGAYVLNDRRRCGWSSCSQPHLKGAIVRSPAGAVVNIGRICAKHNCDTEVLESMAEFKRQQQDFSQRERIEAFQQTISRRRAQVARLMGQPRGAKWAVRWIGQLMTFSQDVPGEIRLELTRISKSGTGAFHYTRVGSENEIELLAATSGRYPSTNEIEVTASIEGTEALRPENDLREILVLDIQERLTQLADVDPRTMPRKALGEAIRWIGGLDDRFRQASVSLGAARRLLVPDNLRQLIPAIRSPQDHRRYQRFLRQLESDLDRPQDP